MNWTPSESFDLVVCLQTLEHLEDDIVDSFAQKLFDVGRNVIISVPHMWPEGACKSHLQDPVDLKKLDLWTQRSASEITLCDQSSWARLVAFYPA